MRTTRSARAIAFDREGRLELIRRIRAGREPYWVTPGGGVETEDEDLRAALRRELWEELGAVAVVGDEIFVLDEGERRTHFFRVTIDRIDPAARSGPEFVDESRGTYDVVTVEPTAGAIAAIHLVPVELHGAVVAAAPPPSDR